MQQHMTAKTKAHPGRITTYYAWNNTSKAEPAEGFPNSIKWKYFAQHGSETNDVSAAAYCVPVAEIKIVSVDRSGKPVAPQHAAHLSITAYGPHHRFLSHTDASASGH